MAMKMTRGLEHLLYEERLSKLCFQNLENIRLQEDVLAAKNTYILTCKIIMPNKNKKAQWEYQ